MTEENGSAARRSHGAGSRVPRRWIHAAAGAGSALLLVVVCVVLGLAIALPLWAFATGARQAYTIAALAAAAAGVAFMAVGAARRRRQAAREHSLPPRSPAVRLLTVLMTLVGVCDAWAVAALLVRRIWVVGATTGVLGVALLWLLGRARAATLARKDRRVSAENQSE